MERKRYKALDFINNHYLIDTYYYDKDDGTVEIIKEKRRSILSKHFTDEDIIDINKPTLNELLEFNIEDKNANEIFKFLDIQFNKEFAFDIVMTWSINDNIEFGNLLKSYLLGRTITHQ